MKNHTKLSRATALVERWRTQARLLRIMADHTSHYRADYISPASANCQQADRFDDCAEELEEVLSNAAGEPCDK